MAPAWMAWCVPLALFFGSGAYTVCETRLLEDLAHAGQGPAFGRARKWGSFGFLAAAALGGALFTATSLGHSFAMTMVLCAAVFLWCCLALAAAGDAAGKSGSLPVAAATSPAPLAPVDGALQAAASTPGHKRSGSAAIAAMRLAEAIASAWFGAYWLATGHSPLETGLLCALPVAAEFLAMWRGQAFVARFSPASLMLVCSAASAARWLATPYCSQLWCAIPLQSMHALSFGFFYPASLLWLKHAWGDQFFQRRYATESSARALAALVSYMAAQWAIAALGFQSLFLLSCVLALLSTLWWAGVRRAAGRPAQTELP
jgi:PPP family 3-phenylpropionic acid transporter